MCGIIGYTGPSQVLDILVEGLATLEYRGYDSAGVATINGGKVQIRRAEGKLVNLDTRLQEQPLQGTSGIGHTRWATHGRPSETNAHPHYAKGIVVVHNGIIENHLPLKDRLRDVIKPAIAYVACLPASVRAVETRYRLESGPQMVRMWVDRESFRPAFDPGVEPLAPSDAGERWRAFRSRFH